MSLLPSRLLSPEALIERAERWVEEGAPAKALAASTKALAKLDRRSGEANQADRQVRAAALHARATALLALGEEGEAVETLLGLDQPGAWADEALRAVVRHHLDQHSLDAKARTAYATLLAREQALPDGIESLTSSLRSLHRPHLDARSRWRALRTANRSLLESCPRLSWPHLHLALIEAFAGRWRPALDRIRAFREFEPAHAEARRLHAMILLELDRPEEVLELTSEGSPRARDTRLELLRAHALRRSGEWEAAARAFERTAQADSLGGDDALAFAHCCLRLGRTDLAQQALPNPREAVDARRDLLLGAAMLMVGDAEGAAKCWTSASEAAPSPGWIPLMARADALGGNWARAVNRLAALEEVPAAELGAFRSVYLGSLRSAARRGHCGSILRSGEDVLPDWLDDDDLVGALAPVLPGAVVDLIEEGSAEAGLVGLREILEALPPLQRYPEAKVALALAHLGTGAFLEAAEAFERARASKPLTEALERHRMRCLVATGRLMEARDVSASLGESEPTLRIRLALAILDGQWPEAYELCEALPALPATIVTRVLFEVGDIARLEALAEQSPVARLHLAWHHALRGDEGAALTTLSEAKGDSIRPSEVKRIEGWIRIRALADERAGQHASGPTSTADEIERLWPEAWGWLVRDARFIERLLRTGRLDLFGRTLEAAERAAGPGNPGSCHWLGVMHLARALDAAATDPDAACAHWTNSVAHTCVALADDEYLHGWLRRRAKVYGARLDDEAVPQLRARVSELYEESFTTHLAPLRERSSAELRHRLDQLASSFAVELRAARLLVDAPPFQIGESARPCVAGPAYLAASGLTSSFASWLDDVGPSETDDVDEPTSPGARLMHALKRMERTGSGRLGAAEVRAIERSFSSLAQAEVARIEGRHSRALALLRSSNGTCPTAGSENPCPGPRRGCSANATHFARCNPAFAGTDAPAKLGRAALDLEVEIRLDLVRASLAAAEPDVEELRRHWVAALELGERTASGERIQTELIRVVSGRAQVLRDRDHYEAALELLELVAELSCDSDLIGILASVHRDAGVHAAMDRSDWGAAVEGLRRAHELNPHSSDIALNLGRALMGHGDELLETDPQHARGLFEHAMAVASSGLTRDPGNRELKDCRMHAHMGLLRVDRSSSPDDPPSLAGLLELLNPASGRRHESRDLLAQGMRKAEEGLLEEAIDDLELALRQDPAHQETRDELIYVLNERAVELTHSGDLRKAVTHLTRACQLAPTDETLAENATSLRRRLHRLEDDAD